MALPISGTLTLDQIYDEAVSGGYAGSKSLKDLSLWTGWINKHSELTASPYAMSEFYGLSVGNNTDFTIEWSFTNNTGETITSDPGRSIEFYIGYFINNKYHATVYFIDFGAPLGNGQTTSGSFNKSWYIPIDVEHPFILIYYDGMNLSSNVNRDITWSQNKIPATPTEWSQINMVSDTGASEVEGIGIMSTETRTHWVNNITSPSRNSVFIKHPQNTLIAPGVSNTIYYIWTLG